MGTRPGVEIAGRLDPAAAFRAAFRYFGKAPAPVTSPPLRLLRQLRQLERPAHSLKRAACGPRQAVTVGTLSRCPGCWPTEPRFSRTKTVAGKHTVSSHGSLAVILCGDSCDQTYIRRSRPAAVSSWEHHALSPAVLRPAASLAGQGSRFCRKGRGPSPLLVGQKAGLSP